MLSSFTVQSDICLFSETWLHQNSIPPWLPDYSGSHFRTNRVRGGESIYIKSSYILTIVVYLPTVNSFEFIIKTLHMNDCFEILLLCVYRSPSCDINEFMFEYDELLPYLSNIFPHINKWIIGGDFNIDLLSISASVESFINTLMLHCLYPTIFKFTRPVSKTLLDKIFLSWATEAKSYVLDVDSRITLLLSPIYIVTDLP